MDAQLIRLTGIEKAVKDTVSPRLVYGRAVNNIPPPGINEGTNPIAGEDGESPAHSPWYEAPSPAHSDLEDTNMDRAGPAGPGGNL